MSGAGGAQQIAPAFSGFASGYNAASAAIAKRRSNQIFNDCMVGRGWRLVPDDK